VSTSRALCVVVAPLPRTPERGRERVTLQSEHARRAARLSARTVGAPAPRFDKNADDAPLPCDGWHWSVSHTTAHVAGCVGAAPLGVDIETHRDARAEVVERVLSLRELALLGDLTPTMFLRAWTAKEAVLKELGAGLGKLGECTIVALEGPDSMRVECSGEVRRVRQLVEADFVASVSSADDRDATWIAVATPIEASVESTP
jgi:phosphopantetheinyl transferase